MLADLVSLPSHQRRLGLPPLACASYVTREADQLDRISGPVVTPEHFLGPPPSFESVLASEVGHRGLFLDTLTRSLQAQGTTVDVKQLFIEQAIFCSRVFCCSPLVLADNFQSPNHLDESKLPFDSGAWQFFPEPQFVDGMRLRFGFMRRDAEPVEGKRRWIYSPVVALDPTVWQMATHSDPQLFRSVCLQIAQQYRLSTHDWAHSLSYSFLDIGEPLPSSLRWFFSPATSPAYAEQGYANFLSWAPEDGYADSHEVAAAEIFSLALHQHVWQQIQRDHPGIDRSVLRHTEHFISDLAALRTAIEAQFDTNSANRAALLIAFAYFNSFHLLFPLSQTEASLNNLRALQLPPFHLAGPSLDSLKILCELTGMPKSGTDSPDWVRDPGLRPLVPHKYAWIPKLLEGFGSDYIDGAYQVPDYDGLRLRLALTDGGIPAWIGSVDSAPALQLLRRFASCHQKMCATPPRSFEEGLRRFRAQS